MPPQRIEFGPVNRRQVGAARVWMKQHWTDAWILQPFVEVDEITWSAAPSLPTATMSWDYGIIARPLPPHAFGQTIRKTAVHRMYVKIEVELEFDDVAGTWTTKVWHGIVDIVNDDIGGSQYRLVNGVMAIYPEGRQQLIAYGLERVLQEHFVRESLIRRDANNTLRLPRGLTFNYRGRPNMRAGIAPLFARLRTEADYWSTRTAIQYLLNEQTPRRPLVNTRMPPFSIAPGFEVLLPDWDRPELPTHGHRTYDLLEQLIPRQRMTGWYCDVEVVAFGTDKVLIKPFTYTADNINIGFGPARPILGNPNQYHLVLDQDRTASVELKETTVTAYDQVVVQGSRRRSCFTVCHADDTLGKSWSNDDQDLYNEGASTAADYPVEAEVKKRQERNQEARSSDKLRHVYRRFEVPNSFDGIAAAGMEPDDPLYGDGGQPVFPDHDPILRRADPPNAVQPAGLGDPGVVMPQQAADAIAGNAAFPVYELEMVLEPTLPLLAGVDYSEDKIREATVDESKARRNREELTMFVAWKLPNTEVDGDDQRWANVEELGKQAKIEKIDDKENHKWSATVRVVDHEPAFELYVHGEPQHVIAKTDFVPLDVDEKIGPLGDHDWQEMLATICVMDDRFVQGVYPANIPVAVDSPRILLIDAGDAYKQDYVAVGTVVSIDATTGQLQRSSGGYLRDDTILMTAAARVAFEYYRLTRRALTITTHYLLDFSLGSFVTQIGDDVDPATLPLDVNSPITEIKLMFPRGTPEQTEPPMMAITTGAGELDALRLLPKGGQALQADAPLVVPHVPNL